MLTESYRSLAIFRTLGILTVAACLACAGVLAARLACADWWARTDTLEGVRRASLLAPGNARYLHRLGADSGAVSPEKSREMLERAIELNPRDSDSWIELGLKREAAGDVPGARQAFLQAVHVSRRFRPQWSLAGFYFRAGEEELFWHWARQAAAVAPGEINALYSLCWRICPDPEEILHRVVPDTTEGLRKYLIFLFTRDDAGGIELVSRRLASHERPEDRELILRGCESLFVRGRFEPALLVWNGLATGGGVGGEPLDPLHGPRLTNGDFKHPPLGRGFGWRVADAPGVTASLDRHAGMLRIRLSGEQPEQVTLLTQTAPVVPNTGYRLRFRHHTSELGEVSGVRWHVVDVFNGADLTEDHDWLASETETAGTVALHDAPSGAFVRVELRYRRVSGEVRRRGWVAVGGIQLEEITP